MAREAPRTPGAAPPKKLLWAGPQGGYTAHSELRSLQFLLAGDLRLGEPCEPLPGIDESLQSRLISAPYTAARQVFDLAVFEHVDFVVLVGEMFSNTGHGIQEPAFLMQQFARLDELGIPVIWSRPGANGVTNWPDWIGWPDNVVELDSVAGQEFRFRAPDAVSASIACLTVKSPKRCDHEAIRIGVVPRSLKPDSSHDQFDILVSQHGAMVAGVDHSIPAEFSRGTGPQGRGFAEFGPHGCWLVSIDAMKNAQVEFIACDAIRYRGEVTEITDATTWNELLRTCELQTRRSQASSHAMTIIKWQIIGHGPLCRELYESIRLTEFLNELRQSLQTQPDYECRVMVADMELVFDPREEARLRSERSSWAAWSSAIDESGAIQLGDARELAAELAVPAPHFHQVRRLALRKLVQASDEE